MPFLRPTLKQLVQQGVQDITSAGIEGVGALLTNSVLGVINTVLSGMSWLHFSYLDWIAKQAVPWTASDEYLAAWGAMKGVYLKQANKAGGQVIFIARGNTTLPTGTLISRPDGLLYITTQDAVRNGDTLQAPVTAVNGGAAGNYALGASVSLASPVIGIESTGSVTQAITGGSDTETQEQFRTRVLDVFRATGSNGREQDYINWALAVSGVTRAWVARNGFGPGTVVLYIMLDNANADLNGFPIGRNGSASLETRYQQATGDQLRVANAIWDEQPVTALVIVCAPQPLTVNFTISDTGTANSEENRKAVYNALQAMFLRLSSPGGTLYPSDWNEAISTVTALPHFTVTAPSTSIIASTGTMPVLGTVTLQS
ncbi:baseplate J/gp47 family protein [Entomobacter blattae]|uniref:Baseplate J-like protein n=1 Tax=Entomobacter blattae TaxID=2762277 RepID=A0A7H1NUJ4_9PROT|nr:baseplate J/gp47 family protein [Entomobacter blattae]QNT79454.1 Baseplate J-like protein [Entomobacter blattae]